MSDLDDSCVQAVVCSPPYAMQRKMQYGGISEQNYPQWTVEWMESLRPKLKEKGSVLIVIRPHIKNGVISDYVLKTRLAVREAGWSECEELIWHKPDAPPLGSLKRPRRSWESVLWFSKTGDPFVNLKAAGNPDSSRLGAFAGSDRFGEGSQSPISKQNRNSFKKGTSRCTDLFESKIGSMDRGVQHPAMYPQGVPDYLIKTFSDCDDLIVDPFAGSGQTALAALRLNRKFLGFEINETFCEIANRRILEFLN